MTAKIEAPIIALGTSCEVATSVTPFEIPAIDEDDFYTFSDLKNGPKPKRDWIIRGLFTTRSINHLVGNVSSGKSVIALQIIKSIREGIDFLGFKPERKGPIVYFGLEDAKARMDERTSKQGWRIDDELPEVFFSHSLKLGQLPGRRKLERAIKKYKPILVVIDPLMLATGGKDVLSNKDMSEFAGNLRDLLKKYDVAFLIVHHSRKTLEKFPDMGEIESGLGATATLALSDTRLILFGKEGEKKITIYGKDAEYATLSVKKDKPTYTWVKKRQYRKGENQGGKSNGGNW